MLDASGRPESGFIWGNNYWLGSQFSCDFLQEPPIIHLALNDHRKHYPNLIEITSPISIEYRIFYIKQNSKLQLDLDIFEKVSIKLI